MHRRMERLSMGPLVSLTLTCVFFVQPFRGSDRRRSPNRRTNVEPPHHAARGSVIRELWEYGAVLLNLDPQGRARGQVIHGLRCSAPWWSLLNPVVFLAVFSFVAKVLGGAAAKDYPVFLLAGLLAWNLFSVLAHVGRASR